MGAKNSQGRVWRDVPPEVLFLDFDNCLHRCDAYVSGQDVVASEPGVALFEFASILGHELQPYPDVKIVLSTDWVGALGFERARDALPLQSLRERVIGATCMDDCDESAFSQLTRGEQIRRYVAKHGLRAWLAIDDRKDGFEPFPEQLVYCQRGVGLRDSDVQKMLGRRLRLVFSVKTNWD